MAFTKALAIPLGVANDAEQVTGMATNFRAGRTEAVLLTPQP